MILSIRHRILLPFLFITVFMTFSAMLISIELVQNHFDNQLSQNAQQQFIPIKTSLHQLAIQSDLLQSNPVKPFHLLKLQKNLNWIRIIFLLLIIRIFIFQNWVKIIKFHFQCRHQISRLQKSPYT